MTATAETGTGEISSDAGSDEGSEPPPGSETTSTGGTTGTTGTPGPTGDDDDGGEADTDPCASFLGCVDVPPPEDCDFWAQDCPSGEKCTPVPGAGEHVWKCVPVLEDATGPGSACSFPDGLPRGTDTCAAGSWCALPDEDLNLRCVEVCSGSPASPGCPGIADGWCTEFDQGKVNLCLSPCDPTGPNDCRPGQACRPLSGSVDGGVGQAVEGFSCILPSVFQTPGKVGETCSCDTCCEPGLLCARAADLAGACEGSSCCTPLCSVAAQACGGAEACVALFEPDNARYADVGACLAG